MQEVKPSFLQYFEQKEKEDNKNSNNDSHKLPTEGDMEVVSTFHSVVSWWHNSNPGYTHEVGLTIILWN